MRGAPSLTSSASTPSLRRLTSSMKAGGKLHSRPTINPIFVFMRGWLLIVSPYVPPNHLLPIRPVVGPAVPHAQGVADALVPESRRKVAIVLVRRVVLADREDDILGPKCGEPYRVVLVPHEVEGIAAVDVQVGVALRHALHVVHPAHAEDAVDLFGVTEAEAGRVIRPEAGTGGDDEGIRVEVRAERQ